MSVLLGFGKAQGLGKKVILIKTLVQQTDFSRVAVTYDICEASGEYGLGIIAKIAELGKVDYAVLQCISAESTFSQSGYGFMVPQVHTYSNNTFLFTIASYVSGLGGEMFGPGAISGNNFSGVFQLRALIIGERTLPIST